MRSDKNHLRGLPREQVPEALKAQAQAEQGARVKVVLAMSVPWFRRLMQFFTETLKFVCAPIPEYAVLRNWLIAVEKAIREVEQAPEGAGLGTAPFHWDAANGGMEARVERVDPIPSEAEPRCMRVPSPGLPQAAQQAVREWWQAGEAVGVLHPALTGAVSITPQQWSEAFLEAERETAHRFRQATCLMANRDGQMECPLCYFGQRMRARLGILDPERPGAAP